MNITFYQQITRFSRPLLHGLLALRRLRGKEDPLRLYERMGQASLPRPQGRLVWIHAASIGEAQSALILLGHIQSDSILMTSGTVTSAKYLSTRLPAHVMHQFMPLDAPQWANAFLDHWRPDAVLWMESEIWPNMLLGLKKRGVSVALINARLSNRSYRRWAIFPSMARQMMDCFTLILAQTEDAAKKYHELGAQNVQVTNNLKYSAAPLPYAENDLVALKEVIGARPMWLYASTHDGEEQLAGRVHKALKVKFPSLLTILVPRHPERRAQIMASLTGHNIYFRAANHRPPERQHEIYIADTLGELGLFYRLSPIALIGRSFSKDGGGGHNPIEAAQLDCAVLTGPYFQYQQELYDEMLAQNAALMALDEQDLVNKLERLLGDLNHLQQQQQRARDYAARKSAVIDTVMHHLTPFLSIQKKAA